MSNNQQEKKEMKYDPLDTMREYWLIEDDQIYLYKMLGVKHRYPDRGYFYMLNLSLDNPKRFHVTDLKEGDSLFWNEKEAWQGLADKRIHDGNWIIDNIIEKRLKS